jgi:hypothetical protein
MRLYHTTSPRAAANILRDGFRGDVWFATPPTDFGVAGTGAVLEIRLRAALARRYEIPVGPLESWDAQRRRWVPDCDGCPTFRAFCIPAAVIASARPRVIGSD